jgi:hypothetical protein
MEVRTSLKHPKNGYLKFPNVLEPPNGSSNFLKAPKGNEHLNFPNVVEPPNGSSNFLKAPKGNEHLNFLPECRRASKWKFELP